MNGDLSGLNVLLTRQFNDELLNSLAELGGHGHVYPLFGIQNILDATLLKKINTKIMQASLVICVSTNAAQIVLPKLAQIPNITWGAMGPGTAKYLSQQGMPQVFYPDKKPYDSAGLLQVLQKNHIKFKNQYIMVLTGERGDAWLQQNLNELGASVEVVPVYRRCMPDVLPEQLARLFNTPPGIDIILITCTTSLVNLIGLAKKLDVQIIHKPLLVISQRIYDFAMAHGFTHVYMANSIATDDIVLALKNYRYVHANSQ